MQIYRSSFMEETSQYPSSYSFVNLEQNQITDVGCKWLAKCEWKKLRHMRVGKTSGNIDSNCIGWEGLKHLGCCDLP